MIFDVDAAENDLEIKHHPPTVRPWLKKVAGMEIYNGIEDTVIDLTLKKEISYSTLLEVLANLQKTY